MSFPPEAPAYVALVLAFVMIVLAARSRELAGWERAGMACLSIALLIQGVLSQKSRVTSTGPIDLLVVGNVLLWVFLATAFLSIARDVVKWRRTSRK